MEISSSELASYLGTTGSHYYWLAVQVGLLPAVRAHILVNLWLGIEML